MMATNENSRTQYAMKNATVAIMTQIMSILFQYVCRIVFVRVLEQEYVGINGLFTNILHMLSLAELGIGSAISYSLYKPIAEKDEELIKALLDVFRKAFYVIAAVVFVAGFMISFKLDFFIVEMPEIKNIELIFMLYVSNISLSYLGTYKSTLISASQRNYICNLIEFVFKIALNLVQIVILIISQNFVLYVGIQSVITIIKNVVYFLVANSMFPTVKEKGNFKLPKNEVNKIVKNVKAMFLHKMGWVIVEATDNLLISKFVSIIMVAKYSSYVIITQSINTILNQIFSSITASIGNLGVIEDNEKKKSVLNKLMFISFVMYCVFSVGICNVVSDFVELCFGHDYRVGSGLVIVISLNFYVIGMRKPTETFLNALGLFYYNRYAPVAESLINLIVSILLVYQFGTIGILLGTLISTVLVPFWITPCVVIKKGINSSVVEYFANYIKYFVVYIVAMFITLVINQNIFMPLFLQCIVKGMVSIIISLSIITLFYRKNENFKWTINLVRRFLQKRA